MAVDKPARIAALQLWVDQGWPAHRLHQKAADLWQLNADETDSLLDEIRSANKTALSIDRAEFLAQQMTRIEALAAKAMEADNLAVALGAFKELHALAGLYQK